MAVNPKTNWYASRAESGCALNATRRSSMPSTMSDRLGSMQFERGTDGGTKLKRIIIGVVVLVAALFLLPSTFTYINPGNVGIVIPRAGGGVDPRPLDPGVHTRIPFATGIEEYPVFLKTVVLTRASNEGSSQNDEINVNSVEGQPVSLDVSLSFELDPAQTPKLYSTFRTDIDQITHGFVKQTIRQALQEVFGTEPVADIISPKKVMQQQALTAQNELQKNTFQAQGDSIKAAGRAKAIMAEAEAQARANQLLAQSITPTLVQYELTKKWNGQMPQVTGGATPLLQLPTKP